MAGLSSVIHKIASKHAASAKKNTYVFGETLGAGGFGVVRRAHNKQTGEDVAIKIISRSKLKDKTKEDAVIEELGMLSRLHHPHIIAFKDWFEASDKYYMVTQLATGGELFDRIIDCGRFTEEDAARNIRDVASAVQYLHHMNIVHRDIKPENLLYVTKDPDSSLVLCDFGVAKSLDSAKDVVQTAAGSLGYAAPEVFHPEEGHGKPCDIWSLGVVLFTILCGYSPFLAESVNEFMDEVDPGYRVRFIPKYWEGVSESAKDLVSNMIVYDPKERFTIDEVIFHPWLSGKAPDAVDLMPTIKPGLASRRRWRQAFEKIRLVKQISRLQMDDEGSDEESPISPGDRFKTVVEVAKQLQELDCNNNT